MRESHDLVIVGAGAAGNAVARWLEGVDALVIDRKREIGKPVECAGLISKRTLELFEFDRDSWFIQNEIYGAYIHSPKGKTYHIGGDGVHAYAIDRSGLERSMAEIARKKGVDYLLNTKVEEAYREGNKIVLRMKEREVETSIAIGADGIDSVIRRSFFQQEPEEVLFGIGVEVEGIDVDPRNVHVFFGNKLAPGFFAWIIPTDRNGKRGRAGLCRPSTISKNPRSMLHDLFNYPTTREYLEDAEVVEVMAGRIPLGYMKESVKDNLILIGDSAFQVKPLSGGGLYPIAEASKICSRVVLEALERRIFDNRILKRYHEGWSSKLKREILFGMLIRRKYLGMKDEDIEDMLSYLEREDVLEVINRYGDMDHPSRLVYPLARRMPILLSLLPKIIGFFL